MNNRARYQKIILLAAIIPALLLIAPTSASAAQTLTLVAEDSFEYTGNVVGKNGGTGFVGAWAFDYGTSDYGMNSSGLTYTGLTTAGGYMYGCTATPNQVCGIKREIPLQNTGVSYIQFLANFGSQSGGGTPMVRLFDGAGSLSGAIGGNGGTQAAKISVMDSTGSPLDDGSASAGTLNSDSLVIVQIDYTNNKTSMWVNPNLSTFSYITPPTANVVRTGLAPVVKNIAFYSRIGYSKFDELKVYKLTGSASSDDSAAIEAAKKREAERAAAIKSAREKLNAALAANSTITMKDMSDADAPLKSVESLLAAYQELIAFRRSVTTPLSAEGVAQKKFNTIMKYAMIERIIGVSSGEVFGRDLVRYGVIDQETPMKQLTTYRLLKLPLSQRDTVDEISAYFAKSSKDFLARKSHLAQLIAKYR